jgi:hypothetical protein
VRKTYKLFIVHSYQHAQLCHDLIGMLSKHPRFEFRDLSIQDIRQVEGANAAVSRAIRKRIKQADAVLAFTCPVATTSGWMQWEIKAARKAGKKIIGIVPPADKRISSLVRSHAAQIVAWDAEAIVQCIRGTKFEADAAKGPPLAAVDTGPVVAEPSAVLVDITAEAAGPPAAAAEIAAEPAPAVPIGDIVGQPAASAALPKDEIAQGDAPVELRSAYWRQLYPFGRRASVEAAKDQPN